MFFELCVQNSYDLKTKFRCVIEINAEVAIAPDQIIWPLAKAYILTKESKNLFCLLIVRNSVLC